MPFCRKGPFLAKTMTFKRFFVRTPPSPLSGLEHSVFVPCIRTLRGSDAKELIGRQGQNGKHEMGSDLSVSSHADHRRAKLVIEEGKDPFCSGAVPVTSFPVRVHRNLRLSAPGIGVHNGNAALPAHEILDRLRVVGGIGQGVEKRRPLSRSLQEIRGGLAVMNRGPRQHAGQRDLSIGREDMEIEPFPGFHLPLAVLFVSPVARLGQRFQNPSGTHPDISGKGRMIFRVGLDHRSPLSLFLPLSLFGKSLDLRRISSGPFPSLDGGPVHGGMFDELRPQMCLNHGSVNPFGHIETDQLGKDAGEGRFVRNLRRILPPHIPARFSSVLSRSIRERVVGSPRTAFATKARQRTLHSWAGRPVHW